MTRDPNNVKRVTAASVRVRGLSCPVCGCEKSFVNYTRHFILNGEKNITARCRTCANPDCAVTFFTEEAVGLS